MEGMSESHWLSGFVKQLRDELSRQISLFTENNAVVNVVVIRKQLATYTCVLNGSLGVRCYKHREKHMQ